MPVQAPARDLRPWVLACAALVVAAVVAAYLGGLHGAFLFDDLGSVAANRSIRDFSTSLKPPAGTTVSGRPFLNLSFAVNYALSGTATWSYHAVNIAVHAGAALALLGIIRRALATPAGGSWGPAECLVLGAASSLLWALHPVQVESVGYVVQRAESLMGLLYLLALYFFIRYSEGGKSSTAWAAASFGACLLGMATKEAMVTAPVVILLFDRTFLAGSFRAAWERGRRLYLALAACWLPLLFQMLYTGGRSGTAGFGSGVPALEYLATQMKAVVLYLRFAAWPRGLVGDYGRILAGSAAQVAPCALFVVATLSATLVLLRVRPALGFLGAWFLVILSPTTSFVPISTEIIALHRMYLPLAALVVLGVLALRSAVGWGWAFWGVVVAAALGLTGATIRRVGVYEGPGAFWGDVALKAPWNAGAWNNLGLIMAQEGNHAAAVGDYRRALEIAPAFAFTHLNLGMELLAENQAGEAIVQLKEALVYLPRDAAVHHQLGKAYAAVGNRSEAVRELHEAVAIDGDRADIWYDLGVVMEQAGYAEAALDSYGRSVALSPGNPEARLSLGNLLVQANRLPEAIVQYEEAVRLQPKAADIHNNLGGVLAESGRLAEARAEFAEAVRLKPDYAEARANLEHVRAMMEREGRP